MKTLNIIKCPNCDCEIHIDGEKVIDGEWECMGHRIGFLKHPYSIDYECSNCRYEVYTLGGLPRLTKYCPQCGARMKNGEADGLSV